MKLAVFCVLPFYFCLAGCGIPNLESAECAAARVAAKQFYSFHFGNDMTPSVENLKMRERFLTTEFAAQLAGRPGDTDPFTRTTDYPRTFKIGTCHAVSPTLMDFQLQIYWRDDQSTVQHEVAAFMRKQGDEWSLDAVESAGHP